MPTVHTPLASPVPCFPCARPAEAGGCVTRVISRPRGPQGLRGGAGGGAVCGRRRAGAQGEGQDGRHGEPVDLCTLGAVRCRRVVQWMCMLHMHTCACARVRNPPPGGRRVHHGGRGGGAGAFRARQRSGHRLAHAGGRTAVLPGRPGVSRVGNSDFVFVFTICQTVIRAVNPSKQGQLATADTLVLHHVCRIRRRRCAS